MTRRIDFEDDVVRVDDEELAEDFWEPAVIAALGPRSDLIPALALLLAGYHQPPPLARAALEDLVRKKEARDESGRRAKRGRPRTYGKDAWRQRADDRRARRREADRIVAAYRRHRADVDQEHAVARAALELLPDRSKIAGERIVRATIKRARK